MNNDYRRLLTAAARLYYEQNLTQAQIAQRLRLSRQKIQRMLREAREEAIVQITIRPMVGTYSDLEYALQDRFTLAEAVVVETADYEDQATVTREVGTGAAEYLLRVIRPHDKIVINWGNGVLAMVNALASLAKHHPKDVTVIQGLGGLGDPNRDIHGMELVKKTAKALSATAVLLTAPAVAGSMNARDAFYSDPSVSRVLERARSADLAFVGIGSTNAESVLVSELWNVVTPSVLGELRKRGAVGSIMLRYFDREGIPVKSELDELVIGLALEELKHVHRVVGIAGGAAKLGAIEAAIAGKLIDVLVTDQITAQRLLARPEALAARR